MRVKRDGGYHYLGYSGAPDLIILNMFLGSLDGLHDYSIINNDKHARACSTRRASPPRRS